jgi:glutamate-ammonia-ligase adenylyltransferase
MVTLPAPADPAAAARLIERFAPVDADFRALLAALGGNSPYLSERAAAEPDLMRRIATDGPSAVLAAALTTLAAQDPAAPRHVIAASLRRAKRHAALAIAAGDIAGILTLDQVTAGLSDLADTALSLAVRHLLLAEAGSGQLRLAGGPDPAISCGFTVLAMGKLGARELNYSSDIDLILLHDPDRHANCPDSPGPVFARIARNLVNLMSHVDEGGYVFRTDLRLRPDPSSTPPSIALPMALTYYESQGRTWERAAMIKARPVAGDIAMGARFLTEIAPFVWRRYLDFAAIADIRAMKTRIDAHKGTALDADFTPASLLGHDLKLGTGGIREIEFCAQTLQLVWGGRETALRAPRTLDILKTLEKIGHIGGAEGDALCQAYIFLRGAEHRLQMVDDRQTHKLPATREGLARFAIFMGFADEAAFSAKVFTHLTAVAAKFDQIVASLPTAQDLSPTELTIPAAFKRPNAVRDAIAAWAEGRPRALRTGRARDLLSPLLPPLLRALSRQPDPDTAFFRFDALIWHLSGGVQILSMFAHNPDLLDRLADVLGAAPFLADHLAQVPSALEGFLTVDPSRLGGASLKTLLHNAASVDEALNRAAPVIRGEEFCIALGELDFKLSTDMAAQLRSQLAEHAIAAILPQIMHDHIRRFGKIPGAAMAVVALGKLGSRDMLAGSDLDLMVIYDHPPDAESVGAKPLAGPHYFARAAHSLIAALTVPTREGPLYAVDMRLRPSGNKGPVAVSISSFEKYHRENARHWERLALTRARVITGQGKFIPRVKNAILTALSAPRDIAGIFADTNAMRDLIHHEMPAKSPWDIKHREGGLIDVEFIAQCLQLVAAQRQNTDPARIFHPNTRQAVRNLLRAGMITADDAAQLIEADRALRGLLGLLRITLGNVPPMTLPENLRLRAARLLHTENSPDAALTAICTSTVARFHRLLGTASGGQAFGLDKLEELP